MSNNNYIIQTSLHCEDVFVIQFAVNEYLENYSDIMDKEVKRRMKKLVHRLFKELYDNPENDKPNGH